MFHPPYNKVKQYRPADENEVSRSEKMRNNYEKNYRSDRNNEQFVFLQAKRKNDVGNFIKQHEKGNKKQAKNQQREIRKNILGENIVERKRNTGVADYAGENIIDDSGREKN